MLRNLCILLVVCLTACSDSTNTNEQNVTESPGVFETFQGADGQYYFHLLAANYEKVLQSEGYVSLAGAEDGIDSVKENGVDLENYDLLEAVSGEWYFNLIAQNYEIIGTSETYVSKQNAERGMETVQNLIILNVAETTATTSNPKFNLFIGNDGQYYFNLQAGNGEIVLQSEGYVQKAGALNGIDSVQENGQLLEQYEIVEAQNGQYFFRLKAQNHEIIARGEVYASLQNAERGVNTVIGLLQDGVADPE